MIGMVTKGQSFYHCLSYCLEDKRSLNEEQKQELSLLEGVQHKNRAEILEYNYCYGNKKELAEQFKDVRKLSKRVEKPVIHISIRVAPGDHLTKGQLAEVGRAAAEEFGLSKNQWVCILHKDTKEQHIHVVGNRVGYDGKVASDSQNYPRMAKLCRRLEIKLNLKQVLSPRPFLSQKERQIPRLDQRKERLKRDIREALKGSRAYPEFEKKMRQKGYVVDKGRGIAFEDNKKVRIKGSEVGYSWRTIETILERQRRLELKQSPGYREERTQKTQKARKAITKGMDKWQHKGKELNLGAELSREVARGMTNLIGVLMKPGHNQESLPREFREDLRRKKRKRKRLHL
jgi:Relaxase/Mobilisation nuclease domain